MPYADANCIPVPGEPGDDLEGALVLLADAFVTGWHATELGRVYPGCTAAVFGAGTIGLLSAYSRLLKGADVVYVVDYVPERLDMAARLGAVPVDFRMGGPGGPDPRARRLPPHPALGPVLHQGRVRRFRPHVIKAVLHP